MSLTIATLRAAGLSAEQIVHVLECAENEKIAARREQNRINQRNHRSRQQIVDDCADGADTADSPSPPPSPPLMVSPITPSLNTPSSSSSSIRAIAVATRPADRFEDFWKAYPKRDGANPKTPARKKFIAAIKSGAEADAIIAGARAYDRAETEKGNVGTPYIAQAVTWLSQRRWEDYAPAPVPNSSPNSLPTTGLPSREELLKRYAVDPGSTENAAIETAPVLDESVRLRSGQQHGMVPGRKRNGTAQSLGEIFCSAGLETVCDQSTGNWQMPPDHDARGMAGMVRAGSCEGTSEDTGIPAFLRRTE
jgi:hypothetical protein